MSSESRRARLLVYVRRHVWIIAAGMMLVTVGVAIGIGVLPFVLCHAIDGLASGEFTLPHIGGLAAAYVLGAVAASLLSLFTRRLMLGLGHRIEREIRDDIFRRLTELDLLFYSRERTGDIMTRMTSDLGSVRECLGPGLLQSSRTVIGFVMAFGVMFVMNIRMAVVMLLLLPVTSGIFFGLLRLIRKRYELVQEQSSHLSNFTQESFAGIRTLKGFAAEQRQTDRFQQVSDTFMSRNLALSRIDRPIWPLMGLIFSLGSVALLVVGGRLVIQEKLTIGQFVQFNQYLVLLQWPMLALGWLANIVQRGIASWGRICTILESEPAIRDAARTDRSLTSISGRITFENVSLSLSGRQLLHDINLEVPVGTTVGITGPTGSGKSLLGYLMARLIDPDSGRVLVDGRDIREFPVRIIRGHVGVAPQEPFLFSDTLASNIAFGLPEEHEERIIWAAEVAQLREEIDLFPEGFQTVLGERGVTLSGGQRQRTAISRAIAKDPQILILDDVFSAIDTHTESRLLQELLPVLRGRTSVIIGHRVSTLRHADVVFVVEQGRLTQCGSHNELIRQDGYYRELDEVQRLEARLESA
ncbi:MAG: ABC transporter ATP-binding protein/permease [Verrucomicrobia bacterium]|nr:ABC transporter ATP-binding protein/permease [Verrucomicrobiota bacterium]